MTSLGRVWLAAVSVVLAVSLAGAGASRPKCDEGDHSIGFLGVERWPQQRQLLSFQVESVNGPVSQNCSRAPWRVRAD